jgi:hypothetical protein
MLRNNNMSRTALHTPTDPAAKQLPTPEQVRSLMAAAHAERSRVVASLVGGLFRRLTKAVRLAKSRGHGPSIHVLPC